MVWLKARTRHLFGCRSQRKGCVLPASPCFHFCGLSNNCVHTHWDVLVNLSLSSNPKGAIVISLTDGSTENSFQC